MNTPKFVVLSLLVAASLAASVPVSATDVVAPAVEAKQAKYILHVDGMT